MPPYDSFLLISFGGPEGRDDVIPFLENVTRGRGVPRERLEQVAEHYYQFGGVSPINQQCRDLLAAIEKEFAASGVDLPVYWGNRNCGSAAHRHGGGHGGRRQAARDRVRDVGIQLLFELQAVPGGHRAGQGGGAGRPADRQAAPVLQPPGLH